MRLAADACHMVTAFRSLDVHVTSWTLFDIARAGPLVELPVNHVLAIGTGNPFVVLNVAVGTDRGQTARTVVYRVARAGAVDLGAIWCRTVVEFVGTSLDVCVEHGSK